jgi:hypothetical protein
VGRWVWLAAAAGASYFFSREPGRRWLRDTGQTVRERYQERRRGLSGRSRVESVVEEAVAHPHQDTAMARAFEDAVHSG